MYNFDVDIDMADRGQFLKTLPHIPAAIATSTEHKKHNTGVYFQPVPVNPENGYCALDHKVAQANGWFKVDFLNNSVYEKIRDEQHLVNLLNTEPMWDLLLYKEVVEQLYHVGNYYDLVLQYQPRSIMQLAMILALIRPAKKYLIGKSWDQIEHEIWKPTTDGSYYFKKSHAVAFATVIVVQLNQICEEVTESS